MESDPHPFASDARRAEYARRRRGLVRARSFVGFGLVVVVVVLFVALTQTIGGMSGAHGARGTSAASYGISNLHGERIIKWRFASTLMKRSLDEYGILPRGYSASQRRPLLVLMNGRTKSGPRGLVRTSVINGLAATGRKAPALLLANGGTASYFHNRADGPWASYITKELIPSAIKRYGLSTKLAFGGISMGGYGALNLTRMEDKRICATGALSPAIYTSGGLSAAGAFDNAQDYARNDVLAFARENKNVFHGTPVYLAGGAGDPFRAGTTDLAGALRGGPSSVIRIMGPGAHDNNYWNPHMAAYLAWYANKLASC